MKKNLISIITFLILCITLPLTNTGCSNSTSISDFNLFAPSDDYKLGLQLDSEIRANPAEYPMLNNAQANAYLQSIVDEIIASKQIKYKGTFAYKVQILDTNIINAFATPGGFIYVYKGLLKFADNEATIAGTQQTGAAGAAPLSTGANSVNTGTYYVSETGGLANYNGTLACTKKI